MKIAITTNEILIPKKTFTPKFEKELEFDFPLPEHCPDIARIIKIDCTPFCEGCEAGEGTATVKGKVVYDLLYETDYKSRLRFVSFVQEFSQTAAMPRNLGKPAAAFCRLNCERIGCKLLSPRRVIVKSTVGAQLALESETAVKAVAVNEDGKAFFRKKTIGFDGITKQYDGSYSFKDILSLAQSEKSIGEIVCGSISLQAPQITLSRGRAEIRTSAAVRVLCEEESNEGKYFTSSKTLPISIDFQNDAIEDHKQISAELAVAESEFSPELDQYGESRNISLAFSVKATLRVSEPKAYTVAEDMFEKDFDGVPTSSKVALPHLYSPTNFGFSAEIKLPPAEAKPELLLDSTARDYGASITKADGGAELNGNFIVTLLADTAEGIQSFDHSLPYSQFVQLDIPEEATLDAEVTPLEVVSTLHADGSVTVRVIASAKIQICTEAEESFITEITKRTAREQAEQGVALVYCFPQSGEELWSIAKHYRVDPESIKNANPESFDESGVASENAKPILIKL